MLHSDLYVLVFSLQKVFVDDPELIIEDVDFCKTHLSLIVKEMQSFKICVVDLPLKAERVKLYPTCTFIDQIDAL